MVSWCFMALLIQSNSCTDEPVSHTIKEQAKTARSKTTAFNMVRQFLSTSTDLKAYFLSKREREVTSCKIHWSVCFQWRMGLPSLRRLRAGREIGQQTDSAIRDIRWSSLKQKKSSGGHRWSGSTFYSLVRSGRSSLLKNPYILYRNPRGNRLNFQA